MKKLFTLGFLFLLPFMATMSFASDKTGTAAPLKSAAADELTPPEFSSTDASNEIWYYIRFARQAVNNLVWSTDYPSDNNSWAIKQSAQKTDDKHTQHWKLVGSLESFYIVNRATGFKVAYAAAEDAEKGIRGGNYIVDVDESTGVATLKLVKSTDPDIGNVTSSVTAVSWAIINPALSATTGYMNDRATSTNYPWRDVCYYNWLDPGSVVEFVYAEKKTIVIPVDSLSIEAPAGQTGRGVFAGIAGFNLSEGITAEIEGSDASAFGFAGDVNTLPAEGGSLTVTFSPLEPKVYNAMLVLSSEGASPVSIRLTGSGFDPSELPLTSSYENEDEHWYYIRFHRKAAANTVWSLSDTTLMIVQDTLKAEAIRDDQMWKICGAWEDGYSLINKSDEREMAYNETPSTDGTKPGDRYMQATMGDIFDFVRFNAGGTPTKDWQLLNRSYAEVNTTTSNKYLNDQAGKFLCNYSLNNDGNRLKFIPVDEPALIVPVDSLIFKAGLGETSTQTLFISGLNLTVPGITVSINEDEGGNFSINGDVTPVTLPATGGKVNVRFSPSATGEYSALLTVACEGFPEKRISLKGSCFQMPVKISRGDSEYWYRLQFTRRSGKLIIDKGLDQIIAQEDIVEDAPVSDDQLWKFTGTWDRYKFVAKSGREFKYDANANGGRYVAAAAETGNIFRVEANADGAWGFYNMTLTSGSRYINDNAGVQIGNYSFDGGGTFNFLPEFASISASDLLFNEVERGNTSVRELNIASHLLTSPITYTLENDGDAFTVTPAGSNTLPQEGGTLTVTFTPTEKRAYSAKLTFSADGADSLTVLLTGTADFSLPVTISTDNNDVWYYIQFERKPDLAWTGDGYGTSIKQAAKEEGNFDQHWKLTGSWDAYSIINRNGGAIFYDELDTQLAWLIEETADGDIFAFKRQNAAANWQLQIINKFADEDKTENYLNDHQGVDICLYLANDGGNPLLFTPVDGTGIPSIDPNDAVVAVKYYTLLGREVVRPATTGVYIVRSVYASGKVQAIKKLFVIQ